MLAQAQIPLTADTPPPPRFAPHTAGGLTAIGPLSGSRLLTRPKLWTCVVPEGKRTVNERFPRPEATERIQSSLPRRGRRSGPPIAFSSILQSNRWSVISDVKRPAGRLPETERSSRMTDKLVLATAGGHKPGPFQVKGASAE
jgi:hypothetical protein